MQHPSPEPNLAAQLAEAGVSDPAHAVRLLYDLTGNGVTDDDIEPLFPLLLDALRESPDPDRALNSFVRWLSSVGNSYSHLQTLHTHPVALELFCLITGCSQYFADLLIRHPEYFEIIANRGVRGGTKTLTRFQREAAALIDACQRPELKKDALRRWKAREMLRIGVRDLAGLADMPSTAREFSNLADTCVQQALQIALASVPGVKGVGCWVLGVGTQNPAQPIAGPTSPYTQHPTPYTPHPTPFAILAMGKLGGQELNYSSDIDLMFVVSDDLPAELELESGRKIETSVWFTRLGETLIKVLNDETSSGHVFRVDMRLRPEGRFGPLVRSLGSYRAYYENWAENWERQALLKVRFIAGDPSLGDSFLEMVTPYVYRPQVSVEFVDDVRANKRRIEQKCVLEGEAETNVKTGYGGIRDIEFIVQLYQLQFGGRLPHLRTPNTLSALQRLRHAGILTNNETRELSDDYKFLRTLEHRLQLLHRFQTQSMPAVTDDRERTFLARRMGFPDRTAFEADLTRRRQRVRAHLDQLFYGDRATPDPRPPIPAAAWTDIGDLLDNQESPSIQQQLAARLSAAGFLDIPAALRALQLPMSGNEFGGMPPDTPHEFKIIAPRLLSLLARSPQPDQGLAGIEALALAVPNRAQLYASFDDSPDLMEKTVSLASASPPLMKRLTHHLEWMEGLLPEDDDDEENVEALGSRNDNPFSAELQDRLRLIKTIDRQLEAVARYNLRETTRAGARDIWDLDTPLRTMTTLTRLAEAVLDSLLRVCAEPIIAGHPQPEFAREALDRVAALGLGKLGGGELGYASDWDLVFVYDEGARQSERRGQERNALAQKLIESVNNASRALATFGAGIEIDLRLRPWGRKGALILTPLAYLDYLKTSGETWERQAALKARFIAGNATVGRRMERVFRAVSFGRGATTEEIAEIIAMKQRIEAERLKPTERETDLKLGLGGLSDIEWLAQKLQFEHGKKMRALCDPNTLRALSALASAQILDRDEAAALSETYQFLTRLRNGLWLLTGQNLDALSQPAHRRALARRFGYSDTESASSEDRLWTGVRRQMTNTRQIFERRFHRIT